MNPQFYDDEIHTLISMVETGKGNQSESVQKLPASEFTCPKRHAREQAMFRAMPLIVAHSSQIPKPGDFLVNDDLGKSYLLVRGGDGTVRGFLNYCQHRGTRLVQRDTGSSVRRFQCPYHGWSYDTAGSLVGVPREDLFPGLERDQKHLREARVDERHGLIWLTQDPDSAIQLDPFVGDMARDLDEIARENTALWFNHTRPLKANWKLPLDAFLESYHIAVLHRESIANYFVKHVAATAACGRHIRSLVPRANILELKQQDWSELNLREYVSPSYIVFPNTCFILHPTSVSLLTVYPGKLPGESTWNHKLLIPAMPRTEHEKNHYDKTIKILDGITFEGEDFWASEQIQQGLNAGALEDLTLGLTEGMLLRFHQCVEATCLEVGAT